MTVKNTRRNPWYKMRFKNIQITVKNMSEKWPRNACPTSMECCISKNIRAWIGTTKGGAARKKSEGDHSWNAFVSSNEILASRDPCQTMTLPLITPYLCFSFSMSSSPSVYRKKNSRAVVIACTVIVISRHAFRHSKVYRIPRCIK